MEEGGPGVPTWDEAMRHAAAWLAKFEKDSGKKIGVTAEGLHADAAAAKAWIAFATELTNRSRSGPFDTPRAR